MTENVADVINKFPFSGTRGEILDVYQQLRHEATGLRLQLRTKQVSIPSQRKLDQKKKTYWTSLIAIFTHKCRKY